jgi:hypothetical protein
MSRREKRFRSGDLHEELGLFLLRGVAFMAPVPRTEDVGADGFATLIRPGEGSFLMPDVSFMVQLKAASVRSILYKKPEAVDWLL